MPMTPNLPDDDNDEARYQRALRRQRPSWWQKVRADFAQEHQEHRALLPIAGVVWAACLALIVWQVMT